MLIRNHRPTINYLDSYRSHYGGREEEVLIREIYATPGLTPAMKMVFACGRSDFCHFLVSRMGSPLHPSMNAEFEICFGEAREWRGALKPVYKDGAGAVTYEIKITLKTAAELLVEGTLSPSVITVQISPPLEFCARTPESWSLPAPTDAETAFAQATWGAQVADARGDYDKARALGRALCRELWPHSGSPSPEIQYYAPFDMYRAMIAGQSQGFCVQFGMIFVLACKCFGLIARNLHIERPVNYDDQTRILLSGMHCTSEIFDRALNRWIFMDLRFYCLGAYLGDEGPLSLGEFHLFMSQPHWRERLRFQVYDMATGTEKRLPMGSPRPAGSPGTGWRTIRSIICRTPASRKRGRRSASRRSCGTESK